MGVAVLLGLLVVFSTVTWIARPLRQLAQQARALSAGDFANRVDGDLPGEFRELADAMNSTSASLSRVVSVTTNTANDVAHSARDLANVSEQISASSADGVVDDRDLDWRRVRAAARAIDDALRHSHQRRRRRARAEE
jgi:methyl-accepting chemotaxis protein-2 (aspartate sensor receptor)